MSKTRSFALLAIGAVALGLAASPASAASTIPPFPDIGNAAGPYDIINVTDPGGVLGASFTGTGSLTAYDNGNDDVYYGVTNNSSQTVLNIGLSGPGIFGFENDGIGAGPAYPGAGSCLTTAPCTTPAAGDNSGGGYGGPLSTFSLIDTSNGIVFFGAGLAPGATTFFALEAPASGISVTGVNNATPLPAALPLFAGGLGVMGLLARRRRKAKS